MNHEFSRTELKPINNPKFWNKLAHLGIQRQSKRVQIIHKLH